MCCASTSHTSGTTALQCLWPTSKYQLYLRELQQQTQTRPQSVHWVTSKKPETSRWPSSWWSPYVYWSSYSQTRIRFKSLHEVMNAHFHHLHSTGIGRDVKVMGTYSLVCHKTGLSDFSHQKATRFFTTTSHYGRHSVIVQHNSKFATVHSRVTVDGYSMEFEYNFLHQFTRAIAHTMPYTYQRSIYLYDIATGPHKELLKKKKGSWVLEKCVLSNFENKLQRTEKKIFSHCRSVLFQDTRKNTV